MTPAEAGRLGAAKTKHRPFIVSRGRRRDSSDDLSTSRIFPYNNLLFDELSVAGMEDDHEVPRELQQVFERNDD